MSLFGVANRAVICSHSWFFSLHSLFYMMFLLWHPLNSADTVPYLLQRFFPGAASNLGCCGLAPFRFLQVIRYLVVILFLFLDAMKAILTPPFASLKVRDHRALLVWCTASCGSFRLYTGVNRLTGQRQQPRLPLATYALWLRHCWYEKEKRKREENEEKE